MKSSIFLLGTILVAAPCAFGQTAPVAVAVPVGDAATPPASDAALQAKIDVAAQALAKLPANTPSLAMAQERVAAARGLVVTPIDFSLGQGTRQARLVLDNLRSARVWCQASAKLTGTNDKALLNTAIESLQSAEMLAQQKAEFLQKPNRRTTEQILVEADKSLAEAAKSHARDAQLLAEGEQMFKQWDELRAALPTNDFSTFIADAEAKNAATKKASDEILRNDQAMINTISSLYSYNDADKKANKLGEAYSKKIDEVFALKKILANSTLNKEEKQRAEAKLEQTVIERDEAERSYLEARKIAGQHLKNYKSATKIERGDGVDAALNPMSREQLFHREKQKFLPIGLRFVQDEQQDLDRLREARDKALQDKNQAIKNYDRVVKFSQPTIDAYLAEVKTLDAKIVTSKKASEDAEAEMIRTGLASTAADILAKNKFYELPEELRNLFSAYKNAEKAKGDAERALEKAKANLAKVTRGQCVAPDVAKPWEDAVDEAQAALDAAIAELTRARTAYETLLAQTSEENKRILAELEVLNADAIAKKALYESAKSAWQATITVWQNNISSREFFEQSNLAQQYKQATEDIGTFLSTKTQTQTDYDAAEKAYKDAGGVDTPTITPAQGRTLIS